MKFIHGGLPPKVACKVYTYQAEGIHPNTVRVEGRETVEAAGRAWDTWVVRSGDW